MVWRSDNGDGNPYFRQSSWRWLLQVVELVLHIVRIYLTILKTVVSGLLQILWKVIRVLMWTIASTGSSPKRKYNAGTGEELLSFRKPLNILFLKMLMDLTVLGLIGSVDSPDTRTGRL